MTRLIQQPDGTLKREDDPTSVAPDTGDTTTVTQKAASVTGRGGKGSYVNKKGQRIYEGDPGYNPSEKGASGFINVEAPSSATQGGATDGRPGGEQNTGAEQTAEQKQIDRLTKENSELKSAAESIKEAAFKGLTAFQDLQKGQYDALEKRLGGMSAQIREIIGGVENKTGNPVVVDENFIKSTEKLRNQFGTNEEQFKRFVEDLAINNAKRQGAAFKQQNANIVGTETPLDPTLSGGKETLPAAPAFSMPDFAKMSPDKATGAMLDLLNNPNATSEEILLGALQLQGVVGDANQKRVMDFLETAAQKTKEYQKTYADLIDKQQDQLTDILEEQKKLANKKYDDGVQDIKDRKAGTMADLNDKRSRLEGYMKAKLKAAGVLNGTFGLNKLVTSVTKFDALIVNTKAGFQKEIRDLDTARTETILGLTTKLVEISQGYDQKLLENVKATNDTLNDYGFKAVQSQNEKDESNMTNWRTTMDSILKSRAEKEKAIQEALEAARKELNEQAKYYTEQSGIIHTVYEGEVVMMFDEDGQPMKNWSRIKDENADQWAREKFAEEANLNRRKFDLSVDQYSLDVEKEEFGQWEAKAKLQLDEWYKSGVLDIQQYKAELSGLEERRKEEEHTWDLEDRYAKEGIAHWEQSNLYSRADRHNNPTAAMYTDGVKQKLEKAGMVYGRDFWEGDFFPGESSNRTIAFRDIDTGVAATAALLDTGQIASWYGQQHYGGRNAIIDKMNEIISEERTGVSAISRNVTPQQLQQLFTERVPDWRKGEVAMTIYSYENNGGISQNAFRPMSRDGSSGNTETAVPWERAKIESWLAENVADVFTRDRIGKTIHGDWTKAKKEGMSLSQFLEGATQTVRSGGDVSAPAATSDSGNMDDAPVDFEL